MKGRKKIAAGMLCCMCILGVNGCGQADSDNSQNVYVGVPIMTKVIFFSMSFWIALKKKSRIWSQKKRKSV